MSHHRVASSVAQVALRGLLAVLVLGAIGVRALRGTGRAEAIRDAKQVTALAGDGIVAPRLTPSLLAGDPAAAERLSAIVRRRVLNAPVVRVKIWDASGRIVFSDVKALVGSRYQLDNEEMAALRSLHSDADVSDLSRPENRFERSYGKLLEVYKGVRGPQGEHLLFEAYLRYSSVAASGQRLWQKFAPALIGGLILLELIQIPLAYLLARRLRERELERRALLQRALDASDLERRRLAVELHNGPVQSLAGVAFTLAAAAGQLPATANGSGEAVREAADRTRATMRELRGMLVGLYPPSLQRTGLRPALSDLLASAATAGIHTDCYVDEGLELPAETEAVVFRAAREAVQNAVKHASPDSIIVRLVEDRGSVKLLVRDDGVGFDANAELERPQDGHIGLSLIADLASEIGGSTRVESEPGSGTDVIVEVPKK